MDNICVGRQGDKSMDITDELEDVLNIYDDNLMRCERNQSNALDGLVLYMKSFIDTYNERVQWQDKLNNLENKLRGNCGGNC